MPAPSRPWVVVALTMSVGALAITGWTAGVVFLIGFLPLAWLPSWRLVAVVPLVVVVAGLIHQPSVPEPGPVTRPGVLTSAVMGGEFRYWATADIEGSAAFLDLPGDHDMDSGDSVMISGRVLDEIAIVRGRPHQVVNVDRIDVIAKSGSIYTRIGVGLRTKVGMTFKGRGEPSALLAGFLVGDISGLSNATVDAMKLAGLSHFVAVSGSNVALFLALVYVVAIPFGISVWARAITGLASLPVFLVATGFEPSVVRASVMAAIVLLGRLWSWELEIWQVLSLAVAGLVALDPWLIRSVGFQLSVAATAGVVVGSRWPGISTKIGRALVVTSGAQLAVAPLLLIHFGSIPVLAPISNLIAAPLVTLATAMAVPAVLGFGPALAGAELVSGIVIQIARMAAGWPQIGWVGLTFVVMAVPLGLRVAKNRTALALGLAAVVAVVALSAGSPPPSGTVVVLDVGQGDAILLSGGPGNYALVDGGPDEAVLLRRLRSFGVDSLSLVVATHGDADHAAGLAGLFGRIPMGMIWERADPHESTHSERLADLAARYGVPVMNPGPGDKLRLGTLTVEVVGPARRYQSPNDQSIVLLVSGFQRNMLLTGDIEVVAQSELPRLEIDVLKVPHHGGGTSDPSWLRQVGAAKAIISVGENSFGHPVDWVVATLQDAGGEVVRTDLEGSIAVDLNSPFP